MMRKTSLILALLAATIPAAASAQARSIEVRHDDLDLNSGAGIAAFDRRIDAAVREVCGPPRLFELDEVRNCRAAAHAQARSQRGRALAAAQAGGGAVRVAASR